MTVPEFKAGDEVEYLVRDDNARYPMWDYLNNTPLDNTILIRGRVTHVNNNIICTEHLRPGGEVIYWNWPNIDNFDYREDQWEREGWIKLVPKAVPGPEKCICDFNDMMNNGCTCGVMHREHTSKSRHVYKRSDYL